MKIHQFCILMFLFVLFACKNQPNLQLFTYTDSLKLRDSASVKGNIIGYLQKSTPIHYLGEKGDSLIALIEGNLIFGQWMKVEADSGKIGWVFSGGLDFDTTKVNYGIFGESFPSADSILFVPDKKKIPVYQLPQLSSKKLYEIEGIQEIFAIAEGEVKCPVTGIKRVWVKSKDEKGDSVYILKSNLTKKIANEISLDDFKKVLTAKYDIIEDEEGYEFKSVKRFANGDDGAEWIDEAELVFNFSGRYIKTGYMYNYGSIEMNRVIKKGNRYTFGTKSGYSSNNKEFEIVLNNDFIRVYNCGELSVKYVPGKADNY